MVPFSDVGCSH
jgi:hypothetical protein